MISKRKDEHIKFAFEEKITTNDFDLVKIDHDSLPDINFDDIDLSILFLGKEFPLPFYINAMTGGSEKAKVINEKLAVIAKKFNLPIVLGSQSAALKDSNLIESYSIIRRIYPEAFIVSNLSANASLEEANYAIDMVKANAYSTHLNVIQELVMNEGDRDFSNWSDNIKILANNLKVPYLVKEVGFGMSKATISKLEKLGVKYIDVSGFGGTNFARIERKRNNSDVNLFDEIGISTVNSILNSNDYQGTIYASGGIRNSHDIFKALYLGANAVGLSNYFLKLTELEEVDAINKVNELIIELKKFCIIYGVKSIKAL